MARQPRRALWCLMTVFAELAARHLALRLRPLARAVRVAADRQAQLAARLIRPDVTPLCVTDEQVHVLLSSVSSGPTLHAGTAEWALNEQEAVLEAALRENATETRGPAVRSSRAAARTQRN